ncbi:unnamed protein product [Cylicocyclus nassatus]|uniref:Uncharacterized protein n=1 Tax=Cylicocyclus nassatus TaxID=53992 RepID=A0AA36M3B0_CYLNA|nr:unnamed protein product [Cylicocyclus nassatus]
MTSFVNWTSKPEVESIKKFFRTIIHEEDVDYAQFESKMDGTDIVTFRENDKAFRLFGTNIHVKVGAYIAGVIGFAVTIAFCITYTFYHSRGMGRNPFLDHLEFVDLIFAFVVGIPCHILLFYSIYREKLFFSPFLVFYLTNFALNVIFTVITLIAASLDLHRELFGNIKYDLGWTVFQIFFTASQGLAIYVVMRCRKYVAAKIYWKERNMDRSSPSIMADGVSIQ